MNSNYEGGFSPFYFSIKEASKVCGISTTTIDRGIKSKTFPPKYQLSKQRKGIRREDVFSWLEGNREWGQK